jgi:hypothetical protein
VQAAAIKVKIKAYTVQPKALPALFCPHALSESALQDTTLLIATIVGLLAAVELFAPKCDPTDWGSFSQCIHEANPSTILSFYLLPHQSLLITM